MSIKFVANAKPKAAAATGTAANGSARAGQRGSTDSQSSAAAVADASMDLLRKTWPVTSVAAEFDPADPNAAVAALDRRLLALWSVDESNAEELLRQCHSIRDMLRECHAATQHPALLAAALTAVALAVEGAGSGLSLNKSAAASTRRRPAALFLAATLLAAFGARVEPLCLPWLRVALVDCPADKLASMRLAAWHFTQLLFTAHVHPHQVAPYLPALYQSLDKTRKWQVRVAGLEALCWLVQRASRVVVAAHMEDILPHVAECMADFKPQVKDQAFSTMMTVVSVITNPDIKELLPQLVQCVADSEKVAVTIKALSGTTFVREIDCATLSLLVPLLVRALAVRSNTPMLRQSSIIIANICKLVPDAQDVARFLPRLLPGLEHIVELGADPELRQVTGGTVEIVKRTIQLAASQDQFKQLHVVSEAELGEIFCQVLASDQAESAESSSLTSCSGQTVPKSVFRAVQQYCCWLTQTLLTCRAIDIYHWRKIADYIATVLPGSSSSSSSSDGDGGKEQLQHRLDAAMKKYRQRALEMANIVAADDEDDDKDVSCDCTFSLAYGGMILLKDAHLHLRRGKCYGLVGRNGCGKTTLLRAIANNQLEGFPPPEKLKTVYVGHSSQGDFDEMIVLDFARQKLPALSVAELQEQLLPFGFDDSRCRVSVGSLSGGWKMKLNLAMAVLERADILLLDEPTNHLDVTNIAWLEKYLGDQTSITSLIVSHDSKFMDNVCTHIIHYAKLQLNTYKCGFSEFVELIPEAKSYVNHESTANDFKFPDPGNLEGVRSRDRKILRMRDVGFQYPTASKPTLRNINLALSLSSRVAIVGPNGAGKSTLIKILVGESEPTAGSMTRHPWLRMAYIAQHAFHHLEQHLESTPNAYIRWRFEKGQDKEIAAMITRQLTPEERQVMLQHQIEYICGRQKVKRTFKYEVKFIGRGLNETVWRMKEDLEAMGLQRLCKLYDDGEAARGGNYDRELTVASVQTHLEEFGLPAEFGTHNSVKGLSGGQKVKVVLAAAMWLKPQILVLDEPTNYLDIQSLNALAEAIRRFKGGVVMVTHNTAFYESVCTEIWEMSDGTLSCLRGKAAGDGAADSAAADPDAVDAGDDEEDLPPVPSMASLSVGQSDSAANGTSPLPQEAFKPAAAPAIEKKFERRKETRRERLAKEKVKLKKLQKYGPKADGTPYSSDEEEPERHVHI